MLLSLSKYLVADSCLLLLLAVYECAKGWSTHLAQKAKALHADGCVQEFVEGNHSLKDFQYLREEIFLCDCAICDGVRD